MSLKDLMKHQIQSGMKKHKIFFVGLNGETRSVDTLGIVSIQPTFIEWRDLNGVFHWTILENLAEIYFDETHRDMIEEKIEDGSS